MCLCACTCVPVRRRARLLLAAAPATEYLERAVSQRRGPYPAVQDAVYTLVDDLLKLPEGKLVCVCRRKRLRVHTRVWAFAAVLVRRVVGTAPRGETTGGRTHECAEAGSALRQPSCVSPACPSLPPALPHQNRLDPLLLAPSNSRPTNPCSCACAVAGLKQGQKVSPQVAWLLDRRRTRRHWERRARRRCIVAVSVYGGY